MKDHNAGFPNDNRETLKNTKASKDTVKFCGKTIILTPYAHGYIAAFEGSEGKFQRGGNKDSAIGRLIRMNQDTD